MASDLQMTIRTASREDRKRIVNLIAFYGFVTDRYPDGSFDFAPTSNESHDLVSDILDDNEIEYENV